MGSSFTLLFWVLQIGEITVPSFTSFDASKHLAWGDISVDSIDNPHMLKVHLKISKTDQLGCGVDMYVGKTDCPLCPLTAVMHYMVLRGPRACPFFIFKNGTPLTKSAFTDMIKERLHGHLGSLRTLLATASALEQQQQQPVQGSKIP